MASNYPDPTEVMASAPPIHQEYGTNQTQPPPPPSYGDQPPSYEASTDPNVSAMPPTYDSLYGEFQQTDSPKGLCHFFMKVIGVLLGTILAAVIIGFLNLIPVAMIIVGAINLNNCRVERYIPIWLIVFGSFSVAKSALNFFYRAKQRRDSGPVDPQENVKQNPCDGLLSCFIIVWFVLGSVWVFAVEPDYSDPASSEYCDHTTYMFARIFIIFCYALLISVLLFSCCCCCCIIAYKSNKRNNPQQ